MYGVFRGKYRQDGQREPPFVGGAVRMDEAEKKLTKAEDKLLKPEKHTE